MMTQSTVPGFEDRKMEVAVRAVEVRAALESFLQKTIVKGTFPGSAQSLDVNFFIQMAADGRAVTGNADAGSAGGK